MSTVDHQAAHAWAKTSDGRVRCGYMGCTARPSADDVERLDAELRTAARMRVALVMTSSTSARST